MKNYINPREIHEQNKKLNEARRTEQGEIYFCESCEKYHKLEDYDIENKWCIECIETLLHFTK